MMKFLQKILGSKEEGKGHVQRHPRVRIPNVDPAVFIASNGKTYPVRNISESGMAILSDEDRFPAEINGDLVVDGEKVYVELMTVRQNGADVGVTIADGGDAVRGLLRRAFSDEFHALEMTEVDASRQKSVDVGNPKWFYAPGNYELFYVEQDGKVIRFEIEWNGNFLAYNSGTIRFGITDHERAPGAHAQSSLVKWQDTIPFEARAKALRLVENVSGMDAGPREQLQKLLKG